MAGFAGFGLVGILAACTPPEDTTSQAPADAPATTDFPYSSEQSPAVDEAPTGTAPGDTAAGTETLEETVRSGDSFTTLEQAIQAAGLEETLSEPGPYTVFAPTDEAFAALPPETLN